MWQADPEGVTILDVRSFEEYVFDGHPHMARNVPLAFLKYERPARGCGTRRARLRARCPRGSPIDPNLRLHSRGEARTAVPTRRSSCMCGSRRARCAGRSTCSRRRASRTSTTSSTASTASSVMDPADPNFLMNKDNGTGWKAAGPSLGRDLNPDLLWENAKRED